MDFTFTEDQLSLRDAIHKFLMVEAAPEMLREIWETASGRSAELRAKLADQGLTALSVPEQYGGMGLGDVDWVLIHQELGYHAIPDSLVATAYLGVYLLKGLAAEASRGRGLPAGQKLAAEWLPKIAAGNARIALGNGINPFIADAANADVLLLGHAGELHALKPAQMKLTHQPSIDASRRLYKVEWTPSEFTRIADVSVGKPLWLGVLDRAGLAIASALIGLAQRMLDIGTDYAAQRKQFGKPIGSFQAVKHHLADVTVKIEFARPLVQRAACSLATNHPLASVHVSQARLAAGEASRLAARKSIQVHGAMGYTWEADLQMYMKRAWALDATWGDAIFHKARVADAIFADGAVLGPDATFATHL